LDSIEAAVACAQEMAIADPEGKAMEPKFRVLAKEEGEAKGVVIVEARNKMKADVAAVPLEGEAVKILEA